MTPDVWTNAPGRRDQIEAFLAGKWTRALDYV